MEVSLTLTDKQYSQLHAHLYPGDGLEAAAILLCGRRAGEKRHRLVTNRVYLIPYEVCSVRTAQQITWDMENVISLFEQARLENWTIVKVHSHPSGYAHFSTTDDDGDKQLLPAIQAWVEGDLFHGSAIMLPDGRMFGRYLTLNQRLAPYHKITVVGDDLLYWLNNEKSEVPDFATSHVQAFGEGTYKLLSNLSVAVVGCSGTGSPVIEQLVRLGIGELLLVDNDIVEKRNLNRILNTTMRDAENKRFKVDVLGDAIERIDLGTKINTINQTLWYPEVVKAVAECDIIFGCVDTIDGRYLLNTIATFYSIPYFDVGVRLIAKPKNEEYGEITEVCGSVHYLKPGFSLMSRKVFDMERVKEAGLARNDPTAFRREVQDGYIQGIAVDRPAVISLNMMIAALGVNEMLARLHPFREESNEKYEHIQISLASMDMFTNGSIQKRETDRCSILGGDVGRGDQKPLLDMPELSRRMPYAENV